MSRMKFFLSTIVISDICNVILPRTNDITFAIHEYPALNFRYPQLHFHKCNQPTTNTILTRTNSHFRYLQSNFKRVKCLWSRYSVSCIKKKNKIKKKKIVNKRSNDWQQRLPNKNRKIKVKYPNSNKVAMPVFPSPKFNSLTLERYLAPLLTT